MVEKAFAIRISVQHKLNDAAIRNPAMDTTLEGIKDIRPGVNQRGALPHIAECVVDTMVGFAMAVPGLVGQVHRKFIPIHQASETLGVQGVAHAQYFIQ